MIGRLKDMMRGRDGGWVISFSTSSDCSELFDELKNDNVEIDIRKCRNRRSTAANAYAWALIDKIAEKLQQKEPKNGWTPTEVYRKAIREIAGISYIVDIETDAIGIFKKSWEKGHLGRQVEYVGGSTKDGWSQIKVWFGSSEFDTEQMSRLIDSLIQEAETQGVPTISEEEEKKMLSWWGK